MGCGASSANNDDAASASELLKRAERLISEDPAQLGEAELEVLRRIAKRRGRFIDPDTDTSATAKGGGNAADGTPRRALRDTWRRVLDDYSHSTVGDEILTALLEIQPMAVIAFYNIPRDAQAGSIARMIDQVVQVESNAASVVPSLLSLGARHALYGLDPSVLKDMQLATMSVLEELTHGEMDAEDRAQWDRTWSIAIDLMTHGLNSPAGAVNRERYERDCARAVRAMWYSILVRQSEGPEETRVMTRVMYKRVLANRPDFARFSNLTDFRTADRILQLLTQTIDKLAAGNDTSVVLRECGARHVAYEVTADDMHAFEPAFLDTCADYLGANEFNVVARHLFSQFWRHVVAGMEVGMRSGDALDPEAARAPREGPIAILFTDIEKSTRLWESQPALMGIALEAHNLIMRKLIMEYGGYEIKTIGDSFMIAFANVTDATLFSCRIQTELMRRAPSAPGFKMATPTQASGPPDVWDDTTLRVRIGIEYSDQYSAQYDPVHRRVDYFGNAINLAARVESVANGGQVVLTASAAAQLQAEQAAKVTEAPTEFLSLKADDPTTEPLANALVVAMFHKGAVLNGVAAPVDLYTVLPRCLAERQFHYGAKNRRQSRTLVQTPLGPTRKPSFSIGSNGSGTVSRKSANSGAATRHPNAVTTDV